jgi:hypothetical protein
MSWLPGRSPKNPYTYDSRSWRQWWRGRRAAYLEFLVDE